MDRSFLCTCCGGFNKIRQGKTVKYVKLTSETKNGEKNKDLYNIIINLIQIIIVHVTLVLKMQRHYLTIVLQIKFNRS